MARKRLCQAGGFLFAAFIGGLFLSVLTSPNRFDGSAFVFGAICRLSTRPTPAALCCGCYVVSLVVAGVLLGWLFWWGQ